MKTERFLFTSVILLLKTASLYSQHRYEGRYYERNPSGSTELDISSILWGIGLLGTGYLIFMNTKDNKSSYPMVIGMISFFAGAICLIPLFAYLFAVLNVVMLVIIIIGIIISVGSSLLKKK